MVDGIETEEVPVRVSVDVDDKGTAFMLPESVLGNFLNGKKGLCVRYPIVEKGVKVRTREPGFTKGGGEITLIPEVVYLALPEDIYMLNMPDTRFMTARTAKIYQNAGETDNTLYACPCLRTTREVEPIELPEQLVMTEE